MTSTTFFGGPTGYGTRSYRVGQRIELAAHTDLWMMGARYGEVVKVGRQLVHVKLDRTGRVHRIHPDNLQIID